MISRPVQIAIFLMLVGVLAGGIYMNRLKERELSREQVKDATGPLSPPIVGSEQKIDLLIAYDDDGVLKKEQATAELPAEPAARAKEVLRTLIRYYSKKPSPHPLGEGSDVIDVFMVEGGLCVIDLNAAFADGHRSGIMMEEMTVASIVESLSFNVPEIKRVKFIVEGKERETLAGHADLGLIYDVPAVDQMAAGLQIK